MAVRRDRSGVAADTKTGTAEAVGSEKAASQSQMVRHYRRRRRLLLLPSALRPVEAERSCPFSVRCSSTTFLCAVCCLQDADAVDVVEEVRFVICRATVKCSVVPIAAAV